MNKYEKKIEELLSQLNNLQQENASLHNLLEKKDTEEKIRDAEERFRIVFENVLDGISIYSEDPDPSKRRLIECNEQLANMAGRSREELLSIGFTLNYQKKLDDNANNIRLEALKKGNSYQGTFSWIRPDGKENVIEYIGTPITWRGKSYSIGIDRDVTEHIKNEEALEKERQLLRTIIEFLPSSVFIKDKKYKKVLVNPVHTDCVSQQLIHLSMDPKVDLLGKTDFDVYPEKIAEVYYQDDKKVIENGETILNKEEPGIGPNGEYSWVLVSKIPIKDKNGSITGMLGITTDITNQKLTEDALRESEEKYRLVFKYSPLGLLSFDENGIIVDCNDKFTQIVGSPLEILIGVNLLNLPDQHLVSALHNALNGKLGLYEDTYYSTLAEKVTPLRGLFTPKYVEGKGITGGVGIIEDISERKKAEEEILKANAELQRINSVKDKFFSIVAHDLKSPFQGLVGMTGMMAEDIDSFSQLELSDFSIKMHRNVKNLMKLLTNLLDWARMQQGTISYEPSEFDLSDLISRNVNLISKSRDQKEIEIILDLGENQIISADEEMLNSIFGNLLSNAVKFTPRGGKISVSTKTIENNMVMITVKDSGIGMPEYLKERLFRIEEKVGRPGTEGEESTGLGLLLCKEFVEKHGGKIWVESRENVGSAFSFTLPKSI